MISLVATGHTTLVPLVGVANGVEVGTGLVVGEAELVTLGVALEVEPGVAVGVALEVALGVALGSGASAAVAVAATNAVPANTSAKAASAAVVLGCFTCWSRHQ